jgi:Carboxypeptidase regulatory-like domain/Photosynthesis system II assembly factor YCF48/Putative zinc-finger
VKEGANPGMDGLKKLVAGRLRTEVVAHHPDADVLSAFAENALSDAERVRILQHLGACNDCRETLYLAASAPESQAVLSFQPKRRPWLMFRWGAVVASVVIVGAAVIARYPGHRPLQESQKPASPATENYSKIAEEKAPPNVRGLRDSLAPAPPPPTKERPAEKHMIAKPHANMEFDDTDQVHVASPARADNAKKSDQSLPVVGRNVMSLPAPSAAAKSAQPVISPSAKDEDQAGASYGYVSRSVQLNARQSVSGAAIDGTIVDPSGTVIGNAKVTLSGPVGSKTASSDPQGRFVFASLAPGSYSVKAEANGFKSTEITNVAVLDNKPATVGVRLVPGSRAETVEISAAAVGMNELAASPAPAEVVNGFAATEAETTLQKAVDSNSPQRAKLITPQWTISAKGALERSTDFGKTWHKVSVAHGAVLRALSVLGAQIWVGGNRGLLYHSSDSGHTWTKVLPAGADALLTVDINHVEFADPNNGTVSTTNGEAWSTSDGGQTWRRK